MNPVAIPAPAAEPERPGAVTAVGWIWIVLAGLVVLRSLLNMTLWSVMEWQAPRMIEDLQQRAKEAWIFDLMLRHVVLKNALVGVASAAVAVFAWGMLQLKNWGRIGVQVACWVSLAYMALFLCAWVVYWPVIAQVAARDRSLTEARMTQVYYGGIGGSLAIGLALIAMIAVLRSRRVRAAFSGT
jgi:hypothetical protein